MQYLHAVLLNHPLLMGLVLFFGPPIVGLIVIREKRVTQIEQVRILESLGEALVPGSKKAGLAPFIDIQLAGPPANNPWTDAETRQLVDNLLAGIPMEVTAVTLHRTLVDLVRRVESLGLFRRGA